MGTGAGSGKGKAETSAGARQSWKTVQNNQRGTLAVRSADGRVTLHETTLEVPSEGRVVARDGKTGAVLGEFARGNKDYIYAKDPQGNTLSLHIGKQPAKINAAKLSEEIPTNAPLSPEAAARKIEEQATPEKQPVTQKAAVKTPEQHLEDVKALVGADFTRYAQELNMRNNGVATKHGLTKAEIAAIVAYTAHGDKNAQIGFEAINNAMREHFNGNDKEYNRLKPLIDNIISGLNKLPKVSGSVARGVNLRKEQFDELERTGKITFPTFLSTTQGSRVAKDYEDKSHHLVIQVTDGRDISSLSEYPQEKEVMMMPGLTAEKSDKIRKEVRSVEETADSMSPGSQLTQAQREQMAEQGVKLGKNDNTKVTYHVPLRQVASATSPAANVPAQPTNVTENIAKASDILHKKVDNTSRGTNNGAAFVGKDGQQRFVKFYENQEQAYNELTANAIYQAAGVLAPQSTLVNNEGKLAIANNWIDGVTMDRHLKMNGRIGARDAEQILDNFVLDLWMSNYDAFGLNGDNALRDESGKIHRVDNGGALLFRARGTPKSDEELNTKSDPDLLMKDIDQYINGGSGGRDGYAQVFKAAGIKSYEDDAFQRLIAPQIERLRALRDNSNNFENLVPKTPPGVSPAIREKILKTLQARAKMIIGD